MQIRCEYSLLGGLSTNGKGRQSKLKVTDDDTVGAYGLIVEGYCSADGGMVAAPPTWERWQFRYDISPSHVRPPQSWSESAASVNLTPVGYALIDRSERRTTLTVPARMPPAAFLHPHLGSTAVVVGQWLGRATFHASSFVCDGGVWAILGDKEDGKSSTIAWALVNGMPIMADDLLVTRDGVVFAGPRCLDLRAGAAEHFGLGRDIGTIGDRPRWRIDLAPVPAELPLRGWIALTWADDVGVRAISAPERFAALARNRAFKLTESRPQAWTPLLGLPMYELSRPRDWTRIDEAMSALLNVIGRA